MQAGSFFFSPAHVRPIWPLWWVRAPPPPKKKKKILWWKWVCQKEMILSCWVKMVIEGVVCLVCGCLLANHDLPLKSWWQVICWVDDKHCTLYMRIVSTCMCMYHCRLQVWQEGCRMVILWPRAACAKQVSALAQGQRWMPRDENHDTTLQSWHWDKWSALKLSSVHL